MSWAALADFHFLRPLWLLGLLGLPLLWWLRGRQREASDPWRAVVDASLLAAQSRGTAARFRLADALLLAGVALALLALAGPAFRQLPVPLLKLQAPLILVLDLSPSVRAGDLKPDRLSRARLKLAELVRRRSDGQTALLVFAGDAFTVAPLTDDATTLDGLLAALDPSILPVPGQRPERAIRRGLRLLTDAGAQRGDMLLLTDRASPAAIAAAAEARQAGLRVSVLGLGTPEGAPVAVGGGGFMRDDSGNIRLPRLDEPSLRDLAEAGGGRYVRFAADSSDLIALGLDVVSGEAIEVETEAGARRYQDEGPLLVLLLLPLAALAARRGWLLLLPLALLPSLPMGSAHASPAALALPAQPSGDSEVSSETGSAAELGGISQFWNDLWSRRDRQAWRALQQEQSAQAAALAVDPQLRGSAAYRAGDYATAAEQFAHGDSADAHYNRGNALAKGERFEDAVAAYQAALAQQPDHADAQANLDAVREWLKQQPQPSEQGESGDQGDQGEQGEQGESEQGQQGKQTPESAEQQQGEPGADQPPQESDSESSPADAQPGENSEGEGSDAEGSEAEDSGQETSEAQAGEDQQAFNEAMRQAMQDAGEDSPPESAEPISAEAMAESERQQAIEQLLRRVPDDPGGLLRRKFLLEYQRRQREGEQ